MRRALTTGIAALALLATAMGAQVSDVDRAVSNEFQTAYNLDQDVAIQMARQTVNAFPNESRAHRALAAIIWLDVLYRRGAVTVDHYMGAITKSNQKLEKAPVDLDTEFKAELGKAIDLANQRVKDRPLDVEARYDVGAAYALDASYKASVEGSVASAFLSARHAFDAEETVLERDPTRIGAGVVVGTYRYVVSGLALPSRVFAYMAGMGGGKDQGIALLEAATADRMAHIDAETALVLIYSREGRHADAMRVLHGLSVEFPRNRLFVLEEGSAAIRAGRAPEAEAILTRGLMMFDHDDRRKIPGEHALWLYKRGLARLNQNHRPDALADLNAALAANPDLWVAGRTRLARAKIADLNGQRADAITDYRIARQLSAITDDDACQNDASRWLKQPFSFAAARN